jgi:DNA-directed RNA polymerase specialized sigma24 family protein
MMGGAIGLAVLASLADAGTASAVRDGAAPARTEHRLSSRSPSAPRSRLPPRWLAGTGSYRPAGVGATRGVAARSDVRSHRQRQRSNLHGAFTVAGLCNGDAGPAVTTSATHRAIDAVWRIESAKIIGSLARIVRDVGVAEELAQDTLVTALARWTETGVPDNPGAWLMAAAKNRALDHLRHSSLVARKHETLGPELQLQRQVAQADFDEAADDDIGDDLLRLMFTACHPVLSTDARRTDVALCSAD